MRHERYPALHGGYLEDGTALLARGDYPRAAEKLWGAAAQAIKAVAAQRRWLRSSHRDLRGVIDRLYRETGNQDLPRLLSTAESLHANFYEDFMSGEVVQLHAGDVRRLVEQLRPFVA